MRFHLDCCICRCHSQENYIQMLRSHRNIQTTNRKTCRYSDREQNEKKRNCIFVCVLLIQTVHRFNAHKHGQLKRQHEWPAPNDNRSTFLSI